MTIKQQQFEGVKEAAARTGLGGSWIKKLAGAGKIDGAFLVNQRCWLIPVDWQPVRQRSPKKPVSDLR